MAAHFYNNILSSILHSRDKKHAAPPPSNRMRKTCKIYGNLQKQSPDFVFDELYLYQPLSVKPNNTGKVGTRAVTKKTYLD